MSVINVRQLTYYLFLFLSLITLSTLRAEADLEAPDEEEERESNTVLRPRNMLRAPASLPASSEDTWSYSPSEHKFSLGVFAAEHLDLSQKNERSNQDITPDFRATTHSLPVFSLRAGYSWGSNWGLLAAGAADVQDGVEDPLLGAVLDLPLTEEISSLGGITFSFPLSSESRNSARLTRVTLSWSPLYQGKRLFAGAYTFFAGHFYRVEEEEEDFSPSVSPALIKERTEGGGTLFLGYDLSNYFSASAAFGVSGAYFSDASTGWSSDATLLRATFSHAGFSASGAFSLTGSASGQAALPSTPVVAFRLHYIFGSGQQLGLGRAESAAFLR